jgi:transcriptional regulator with XRE-family HTH domain
MRYETLDEKELALSLTAIRRAVGLTQEVLAERCGVSPSTVARHERGEDAPSAVLFLHYCREMGLLPAEFLRVHSDLVRARARLQEGRHWFDRLENEDLARVRPAFDDRDTAQLFANGAAEMFEALIRSLQRS